MSGIIGMGHVVLWVRDEAASADFYRDLLGVEVKRHPQGATSGPLALGEQLVTR